jgi:phosphate transport system substrate-binding protein
MPKHLVAAVAAATLATIVATSVHAASLTGAGGTAIYPLLSNWAEQYAKDGGDTVTYQPVGSGSGIRNIESRIVLFANSDMPLKPEDVAKKGLVQFPQVIISITPIVHLAGVKPGELVLDGATLADVFLGKIAQWDDPAIRKLNPGVTLPHLAITPVHRSDASGTTFNFADYLSKVSADWKSRVGAGTLVSWPTGAVGQGNAGVAATVERIDGAIGYVEYAYVMQNHLVYTDMINRSGKRVAPRLEAFQAAAANADFTTVKDFYLILTDQPGDKSWPITAATYMLLRKDRAADENHRALAFLDWALRKGQEQARALNYVPLPDDVVRQIEAHWAHELGEAWKAPTH